MSTPPTSTHPDYFDLQVNGYDGVDFNADQLPPSDVARACERLRRDDVTGILATVITADLDAMCRRLQNICRARDEESIVAQVIRGIHIEGPFLSSLPGYVGAHPVEAVCPADRDSASRLLDACEGLARIVTLAPECDENAAVTKLLVESGVTVSAGHCDPDSATLLRCIDAGLSMFTHLGNACPLSLRRHDNIIQRVLSLSEHLSIGFIGDGIHVPYPALKNYLTVTGFDRAFIVTDAIAAAGRGPGEFQLGDQRVIVDENLATWSADCEHLVGSAATMPRVVKGLSDQVGLTQLQISRLTSRNPRKAISI